MADPKIVKARQRQKTDTTANWEKAANFVPLKGEIIVYQDSGVAPKFKIGDGTSTVGDLKFVSGGLTSEDIDTTLSKSGKAADAKVAGDAIKSLVSRVTTTERNIETNSDNISTLQNQANTNSSNISILQGEAKTNSDNITSLSGRVKTNSDNITSLQSQAKTNSDDIAFLQGQDYATKDYVQGEISKAELGGGGDIDVSGLATKQDLADLIDDSLRKSGKAADAKIVGDRFDSLDTIIAVDENSDGNIVLRPYLPEDGESDGSKIDSEYGMAKYLTNKGWFSLVNEETETGCTFLNDFDYENDEPYLEILGDNDEPVRLGNISAPVSELDVVNKQYADGKYAPADHTHDYHRKNLLDNWYFADPINQRGVTQYTAEGFCIDRWSFEQWKPSGQSVELRSGCVAIVSGAAASVNNTTKLKQTITNFQSLAGKTVTFSAKLKNVTVNGGPRLTIYYGGSKKDMSITSANANSIISVTATLPTTLSSMYVAIGNDGNAAGKGGFDIEIESVKLEVGSFSTIADDLPPKKSEQLLECQRYFWRSAGYNAYTGYKSTTPYAFIQTPVLMRTTPTVTLGSTNYIYGASGRAVFSGTNIVSSTQQQGQFIRLALDESKADATQSPYTGYTFVTGESGISLSAEV